ncbi:MAG TPA: VTT domain-containing protein [Kofleriaceae bacterium]|nr:VTT domain-containing protein [Kofleriaceae bacterium]
MNQIAKLWLKLALGAVGLVAIVAFLGHTFRPELETMGHAFLDRFGYGGIALGTFAADGLHVPVPPQFYMLASIVAGWSVPGTLLAVCVGSLLGGITAYSIARKASNLAFVQRLLARSQQKVDWLFERYGRWAVAIGSLTPIPYSFLCYFAGAYRMRPGIFVALALFRIPKIALYFYLVKLGWSADWDATEHATLEPE